MFDKDELIKFCIQENFKKNSIKYIKTRKNFTLESHESILEINEKEMKFVQGHDSQDYWRLNFLINLIKETVIKNSLKLNCKIILSLGDIVNYKEKYTRLCFSTHDNSNHIQIPDPHICLNITPNIKNFLQNEPSLKQKKDQLCFFGSDTGNIDETLLNQRVTFCLKSINKEKITAKITNFVNFSKDELRDLGMDPDSIESSFVSIKEQLFYKFILDLDGYSSSWDRTAWAMASNSYLIHIKSNLQKFLTWYYPFIEKNNILPFYTQEEVLNLF